MTRGQAEFGELAERLGAAHRLQKLVIVPRTFGFRRLLHFHDVHVVLEQTIGADRGVLNEGVADLHLVQFVHHLVGVGGSGLLDGLQIGHRRGIERRLRERRLLPHLVEETLGETTRPVVEVPVPGGGEHEALRNVETHGVDVGQEQSRDAGRIVLVRPNSEAAFIELIVSAPALARPSTCAPDPCACRR